MSLSFLVRYEIDQSLVSIWTNEALCAWYSAGPTWWANEVISGPADHRKYPYRLAAPTRALTAGK